MKQVVNSSGVPIDGMFKDSNGAIILDAPIKYKNNKIQHERFSEMNREIDDLKEKMQKILESLERTA
jgi:hypothetical protein